MVRARTPRTPDASGTAAVGAAAARTGTALSAEEVVKVFVSGGGAPVTAVDRVSLTVAAGGTLALVGPSGSGKSTLLHLLGAIERADGGRITVGDTDLTAVNRAALTRFRARIGFVFQRFHLIPALTARDNVIAPVLPYGNRSAALARADELLAAVGLAGREHRLPSQLSGGQQQRVAIARALINRPALLLADEPTGNLDSANSAEIVDLLLRLNTEHGTTLVLATHDPGIAARCDRTVGMRDGRIVEDRTRPEAPA